MSREMILMNDLIQEITMGPFGSDIKVDNFIESGVPVLNGSNVRGVKLTEESFNYISEEKAKSLKKANTKRGDIVITHRGTLGQVSYIPENSNYDNYIISQSQFRVTLKKDLVDPVFFTYYFHSSEGQKRLLSFKNHVGVPALAQATTNFRLLQFPYKPLAKQLQIAKVLSDLDTKIELNNQINQELEAMAKTLYDYWFVQFDFPNEEGKPYKTSGGKMFYNEELKREVPEGWEVKELGKYAKIKKGTLITEKTADTDGNVKVVSAGLDFSYFHSKSNYSENTITISASGANAGYVNYWREPIFACDCTTVRGSNTADTLIILEFLKMRQGFIFKQARGSAQPHVYPKDIEVLSFPVPPKELIDHFSKIVLSSNKKVTNNLIENQLLVELRDWLLPMLMNGQVRVKEGYRMGEERLGKVAEARSEY